MGGKQYKFRGAGGGGAVSSVFGRTGAVTAQVNDYSAFYQGVPISKTVAQMQALIGSFIPGQVYKITNQTYFPDGLYVTAFSADELFVNGNGAFINGAMASYVMAEVGYELITDSVTSVYVDHLQDGTKTDVLITDSGNGAIATWPFDSATIAQVRAINPLIAGNLDGTIAGISLGSGASIACGAGCTLQNIVKGAGGQISATDPGGNPGLIGDCTIGVNTVVNAVGWSIMNTTVGDGKLLDTGSMTPGGSIANKVWVGDYNTIEIDNDDTNGNQLDMGTNAGTIDMSNFQWAGILFVKSDGVTAIDSITNITSGSVIKIVNDGVFDNLPINDTLVNGGNIYLEVSNSQITIDKQFSGLEYIELKNDGTYIMQQSSVIRI